MSIRGGSYMFFRGWWESVGLCILLTYVPCCSFWRSHESICSLSPCISPGFLLSPSCAFCGLPEGGLLDTGPAHTASGEEASDSSDWDEFRVVRGKCKHVSSLCQDIGTTPQRERRRSKGPNRTHMRPGHYQSNPEASLVTGGVQFLSALSSWDRYG